MSADALLGLIPLIIDIERISFGHFKSRYLRGWGNNRYVEYDTSINVD